jgi:hypothetical protein
MLWRIEAFDLMRALVFATRRPIRVTVAMIAITLVSFFAVTRMRTDVFSHLNMPGAKEPYVQSFDHTSSHYNL